MTTKPYFTNGLVTLYHGDCLEVLDWLTADVLITDPPYGMEYQSNASKWNGPSEKIEGDDDTEDRDRVLEMWRADAGRRHMAGPLDRAALVFGTWRVPRPDHIRQLIIWDKGESPGMGDTSLPWGPSHEDIYALGKTGHTGQRTGSVIRVPGYAAGAADRPDHPTPKPIPLMEKLVGRTVGTIADPFAGSGATLIAARNLGRPVIGVEKKEEYCDMIVRRLEQQVFDFGDLSAS